MMSTAGGPAVETKEPRMVDARALRTGHARRSPECAPVKTTRDRRCAACSAALDDTEAVRVRLHDLMVERARIEDLRAANRAEIGAAMREAVDAGLSKSELHRFTGLSRPTIDDLLGGSEGRAGLQQDGDAAP